MILTQKDIARLQGVHPDLVKVIYAAAAKTAQPFVVTEGERSNARQAELLKAGKSKTIKGRHVAANNACKLACAVDLAIWHDRDADRVVDVDELSWKFPEYKALADVVKAAAAECNVVIEWGGDWTSLKDGPHFQLPWVRYP